MMVPERIEQEITIAAPVQRVWDVLTQADHVGTWFADAGAEVELRPGGKMILSWREHGTYQGVVERVEPPRLFSFRGAINPDEELREDNCTLVEFTLTPDGEGTRLRVVESGYQALRGSEEEKAKHAQENAEGWRDKLVELRTYAQGLSA